LILRRLLLPVAVCCVALAASGCGAVKKVTSGDPSNGKTLFTAKCASCHTLADAKSQGTVGPNLDDAFSSDKTQGFSIQTMTDVVRGQIAYPDPENAMPPNLVTGQDASDVAVYVAKCSGNPNCGVTPAKPSASPTTTTGGTTTTAQPSGGGTAQGKQVFASAGCGGCHTLKDAGTTGNVGPNLDGLKPSKDTVAKQVTNGGGGMPPFKGQLTPAQIQAVADYVSSVAGK
jgi:mono/diheme cytochrome c family protein